MTKRPHSPSGLPPAVDEPDEAIGRNVDSVLTPKEVIIECQKRDDYPASLKRLLDTIETYSITWW